MFDAQLQTLVTSLVVCGVREYWNGEGTRFLCFISPHINYEKPAFRTFSTLWASLSAVIPLPP